MLRALGYLLHLTFRYGPFAAASQFKVLRWAVTRPDLFYLWSAHIEKEAEARDLTVQGHNLACEEADRIRRLHPRFPLTSHGDPHAMFEAAFMDPNSKIEEITDDDGV